MSEGRAPYSKKSGSGRPGTGTRGTPRPPARDDTSEALLEIADELEEQARDLLRQARQLQKMAEKMSHPARSGGAPRAAWSGEQKDRGGAPRVARSGDQKDRGAGARRGPEGEGRSRGEGRTTAEPDDEWRSMSDRKPRRSASSDRPPTGGRSGGSRSGGSRPGGSRSGGGGGEDRKPDRGPPKPNWAPKGKRPRGG